MRIRIALALAAAGLLVLASAGPALAAITVANSNDSGPGSLRQAIAEAPPGETIVLPAGTYTLTSDPLVIMKSLNISGAGSASTIIRAGAPISVVVLVGPSSSTMSSTISGVTIRDGNLSGAFAFGAGLISVDTDLTLRDVAVTNNTVNANGPPGTDGGYAEGAGVISVDGELKLIDSSVTDNTATAIGGSGAAGGRASAGGIVIVGPFRIENSTISGNLADARGGQGPASPAQDGGKSEGAGIIAVADSPAASTVVGSTLSGNVGDASGGPGGGGGEVTGAGLLNVTTGTSLTFNNSTIAANVARNSGGVEPARGGGAYAVPVAGGSVSFVGTTFASNRLETSSPSSAGGNLFTGGTGPVFFRNTIVANGVGPAGSQNCAPGTRTSLGFNLDGLDQCGFGSAGDQVNKDPLLGPLQLNGGPTQTLLPAANSPAVDRGAAFGLAADQRAVVRPIDLPSIPNSAAPGADGSDIGAVEFQPSNALSLGKLTRNKKKGTATLAVFLPQPSVGTLTLAGKGLKTQTLQIAGETEVKLKVVARAKAIKKALRKKGKRKVGIAVTYAPTGNAPATLTLKAKLIKKKKKKKRSKPSRK